MMHLKKKLWIGIIILTLLSPVGIILPEKFNAGDAWGEWSVETIKEMLGFVPAKLEDNADIWKAPIPDYNLGDDESSFLTQAFSYILSAVIGIAIIIFLTLGFRKIIIKHE